MAGLQAIAEEATLNDTKVYDTAPFDSKADTLNEVITIISLIYPNIDPEPITSAFDTVERLFNGKYPGYRACNTDYHNHDHTVDVLLATARLIHGVVLNGFTFTEHQAIIGLITALLHDVGYIQEEHDTEGTGSKHTAIHVQRSSDFLERHASEFGLSKKDVEDGKAIILCTDCNIDMSSLSFSSSEMKNLGKILGTSDLLAQMADRAYLEKLLFLYHEFKEAGFGDYESELDLLRKTVAFHNNIEKRFKNDLDSMDRYMSSHFFSRWGGNESLYHTGIEKQKKYLQHILKMPDSDPRDYLKRDGIVGKVRKKYR